MMNLTLETLTARQAALRRYANRLSQSPTDGHAYNFLVASGVFSFCDNAAIRLQMLSERQDLDQTWIAKELQHLNGEIDYQFEEVAARLQESPPLSPMQWLARARVFYLDETDPLHPVKLVYRGKAGWAIQFFDDSCLGKDGKKHYQPSPSSMSERFIENTRWQNQEEAYQFWCQWTENNPSSKD